MSVTIQIKRGTEAQIQAATLAIGELAFATDTKSVITYDGVAKQLVGRALYNTLANRPTYGVAGRLFVDSGTGVLYVDSGSSWISLGSVSHTSLTDIGTNTHSQIDTFIGTKAAASGLASLNGSSLVVQNPANATATPTASKIPIADGSGKLDGWVSLSGKASTDHDTTHILGGSDVIDGDRIEISWNPTNSTPATVEGYADSVDNLTAHLKGIDTALASSAATDISALENTLIQIAWDVYSEDRAFDDIYADDLTDQTGIDTVNSTGTYNSGSSYYSPTAALTGTTTDYTSSQLNTTNWTDINSVAITQTTPGDVTASAIYHAVSFDGGTTYKVYKSSAWTTVAYNNSGTWQYNNAGSLTNASTNSLDEALEQSTDQSAYQWTKTNIEAMTDANWEESGGWSTSVNTIDWTYRLVDGLSYVADGASNSGTDYITPQMTGATTSGVTASASSEYTTYGCYAWKAFDRTNTDADGTWGATSVPPQWIQIDFGSGNPKVVNKYQYQTRDSVNEPYDPKAWTILGSNDGTNFTILHTEPDATNPANNAWSSYYTFSNSTPYRYYRMNITDRYSGASSIPLSVGEIKFVEATTTTATPTYTKTTFNHDTEYVALDLRTNGWEASANDPTDGYVVLDVEPVDAITNNTDIKTYISIDNGSNYEQVTLESTPFREIGDHDYLRGDISGITARTDKTIRFKVTSHNSKNFKLHGLGGGVKY